MRIGWFERVHDTSDAISNRQECEIRTHTLSTATPSEFGRPDHRRRSHFEIESTSSSFDAALKLPLKLGDMIRFGPWLLHYSDLEMPVSRK